MNKTIGIVLLIATALSARSQQDDRIRLFINCQTWCYQEYIVSQLTWVDYVRDLQSCDVDLLITSLTNGSSGQQYNLAFTGHGRFAGLADTLQCTTTAIQTDDEIRNLLVHTVQMGLMRYAARTHDIRHINISHSEVTEGAGTGSNPETDRWNAWVFRLGLNGSADGQQIYTSGQAAASFSASRVTEAIKINFSGRSGYTESRYEIGGVTDVYIQRNNNLNAQVIWSLSPRLSAGLFGSSGNSDFQNIDFNGNLSAAIEFNFFPYSDAQTRSLTLSYYPGGTFYNFHEMTIFNKEEQWVPEQQLNLSLGLTKPWGSVSFSLNGSTFLNDISKHRYGGFTNLDVRIFKGLSVNTFFTYDVIRDQINIPSAGATEQEILLQQQVLATNYSFFTYFGISYRFGSIYNNVVNPRFEGGGGSFSF